MLEIPKAHIPKQKDETSLYVTVTKVEKSCEMTARLNPKQSLQNGKSAGKPRTEETPTTILVNESRLQAIGSRSGAPLYERVKIWSALM